MVQSGDVARNYKSKYLIPHDLTIGQLNYVIRKKLTLSHEKALFLFCNNIIIPTSAILKDIYNEYKDADNFLYLTVSLEKSFG